MQLNLLERQEELETLRWVVDEGADGRGALVMVEGPAGIGKTSLLEAAATAARERGVRVCKARGHPLEREYAFGLVRQLFETQIPLEDDAVFTGAAGAAESVFGLSQDHPQAGESAVILNGLYWLAVNMAERQPSCLVVDDAHWGDAPSLRFLVYLANRLEALPITVVIGARPVEPSVELSVADSLASHPAATFLRPSPLSEAACEQMIGALFETEPDSDFKAACVRASQGNPFFLREILVAAHTAGDSPTAHSVECLVASPSLASTLLRRVGDLPPEVSRVAQVCAVFGEQASAQALAELTGLDDAALDRALEALARSEILKEDQTAFAHPVIQSAILTDLSRTARRRLHSDAASFLQRLGAPAEQIAAHLLQTPASGSQQVVDLLLAAAREAAVRGAPDIAATYLHRALEEPPGSDQARLSVLLELGVAEVAARGPMGLEYLRQAFQLAADPLQRAAIAVQLGTGLFSQGETADAAESLELALGELRDLDTEMAAVLEAQVSVIALTDRAMLARVGGSDALAERLQISDDPTSQAALSWILAASTAPASSGADLAESVLAEASLDLPQDTFLLAVAAPALMAAGRLEEADAIWRRTSAGAREEGRMLSLSFAAVLHAPVLIRLGQLDRVERDLGEVLALKSELERLGASFGVGAAWLLAPTIDLLLEQGRIEQAEEVSAREGLRPPFPELWQFNCLLDSLARLRLAQGRTEEGVAMLKECGARLEAWGVRNPALVPWRSHLAVALATSGDSDAAQPLIAEELELASSFGVARELGMAQRAAGLIEKGERQLTMLEQSTETLASSSARLEHARALVDLGAALRRQNQRVRSRGPLREGLEMAQRCAARALAERAHSELLASGARPRRLAQRGWGSLTASEERVAEMAAEGDTNREIAERLFVTEKTIEGHLSNIYRKLEIGSRTELPRAREQAEGGPAQADSDRQRVKKAL